MMTENKATGVEIWKLYLLSFLIVTLTNQNIYRILSKASDISNGLYLKFTKGCYPYPFFEMFDAFSFATMDMIVIAFLFILLGSMSLPKKALHIIFVTFLQVIMAVFLEIAIKPGALT